MRSVSSCRLGRRLCAQDLVERRSESARTADVTGVTARHLHELLSEPIGQRCGGAMRKGATGAGSGGWHDLCRNRYERIEIQLKTMSRRGVIGQEEDKVRPVSSHAFGTWLGHVGTRFGVVAGGHAADGQHLRNRTGWSIAPEGVIDVSLSLVEAAPIRLGQELGHRSLMGDEESHLIRMAGDQHQSDERAETGAEDVGGLVGELSEEQVRVFSVGFNAHRLMGIIEATAGQSSTVVGDHLIAIGKERSEGVRAVGVASSTLEDEQQRPVAADFVEEGGARYGECAVARCDHVGGSSRVCEPRITTPATASRRPRRSRPSAESHRPVTRFSRRLDE